MSVMRYLSPGRMLALNAVLGVALVLAALLVVRDTVSLRRAASSPPPAAPAKAAAHEGAKPFESYASAVEQGNPFGIPGGKLERITAKTGAAQSALEVKVVGIIAWPGGRGYAMLSSPSIPQDVYRAGREIPGVGRLKAVYPYKVIITSGGKDVELKLIEDSAMPVSAPEAIKPAGGRGEFARRTSDNAFSVDREALRESLENPQKLMTDARMVPNMEGASQHGFILREIRPGGIYQKLGLKNGDVLLRVNEFEISDTESALQAFTALKGLDRVALDIVRGGANMTLTYSVQ